MQPRQKVACEWKLPNRCSFRAFGTLADAVQHTNIVIYKMRLRVAQINDFGGASLPRDDYDLIAVVEQNFHPLPFKYQPRGFTVYPHRPTGRYASRTQTARQR